MKLNKKVIAVKNCISYIQDKNSYHWCENYPVFARVCTLGKLHASHSASHYLLRETWSHDSIGTPVIARQAHFGVRRAAPLFFCARP